MSSPLRLRLSVTMRLALATISPLIRLAWAVLLAEVSPKVPTSKR
ncbi:hypothetical protein [Enterobacter phage 01_vB_Eclo_IJM]|nr:hypothetical protein [Enterobacter phage 01_vB_Eclo_IJM]